MINSEKLVKKGLKINRWTLDNGAQCIATSMPEATLTCIDLWCKAGSYYERTGEEGIAHFLEHMIFKGSEKLKEGEFDLNVEALGGSSNAATGLDDVHFYVLVPSNGVPEVVNLLIELVTSPSINERAYKLEREVVLEEIAQQNDQPEERIFQTLLENCWYSHNYGRPILGAENTLRSSSSSIMKSFHKRQYQAKNMVLSIAGVIPEDISKTIGKGKLANIKNSTATGQSIQELQELIFHKERKIIELKRMESARLMMAWQIPPAKDQHTIVGFDIATSLLGEGRRSRLVSKLREELQIVESIDMDVTALEQGGLVILEVCCIEENLEQVENEILKILKDIHVNKPSEKEVNRAKKLIRNGLLFSLEVPSQVTAITGSQALWDRNAPLLEPINYIDNWTSQKLQQEIFQHLQPENAFVLIAKKDPDN